MTALTLISVPFHLGHRAKTTGRGPLELLGRQGLVDRLRAAGHEIEVVELSEPVGGHEIGRVFELERQVAHQVATTRRARRTPMVLAGDCNVCVGVLGGLSPLRPGIVWLDAHGDFHTPASTESGFFDGMALTLATGGAWQRLVSSVPGFRPAAEHDVVLVGVRALESSERDRLRSSGVTVIRGGSGPGNPPFEEVERAVDRLADRVDGIYLHVDLDAIDPLFGRANSLAVPGGLSSDDVRALAVAVRRRCPILGTSFTAYDPRCDSRFAKTALEVVLTIAEIV